MITLAQQNGGPNVAESFNSSVLALRKELTALQARDYAADVPEFALILRVNGDLTNFGPGGVEKPKVRKNYIQVDIVVSQAQWDCSPKAQREYLASVVEDALRQIHTVLHARGRLVKERNLLSEFSLIRKRFLRADAPG